MSEITNFVEFTADVGSWKVGAIEALKPSVARGLIEAGQAKESDSLAYMRASLEATSDKRFADLKEEIRALRTPSKPQGPPTGGGGVDFQKISGGEASEERGKKCFTDVLRCIHATNSNGTPPQIRDYCNRRLMRVYAEEQIEYKERDDGTVDSVVTRNLPGGGQEVITRTGTDSLSGGATYGFTVKPEYLGELFRIAHEQEVFAGKARNIPITQGLEVKFPALDQYSAPTVLGGIPQAASFAGIQVGYVGETTVRPSSDGVVNEITYKAVDLTGMTDFSRDYIVDNYVAMDSVVTGLFGEAMAWVEDWVTIRGDGVGKPQGYFNSGATINGGGIAGGATRAVTNTIVSQDLAWMLSHMATQCWKSAQWIAHPSVITALFVLNNAAGTPVFQPNSLVAQSDALSMQQGSTVSGMVSRPMFQLFGYPGYFTEKVPQLGGTGDISLVCPSQYGVARRAGIEIGMSEHFYFSTDRIAFRFKMRHDGKSLWRKPYIDASVPATPASGWQTSPFITLNTL